MTRTLALTVAAAALVAAGSLVTVPASAVDPAVRVDLLAHAAGYAVIAGLATTHLAERGHGWAAPLAAVLLAGALGAGLELAQGPLASRTTALSDGVANLLGAALGAGLAWRPRRRDGVE